MKGGNGVQWGHVLLKICACQDRTSLLLSCWRSRAEAVPSCGEFNVKDLWFWAVLWCLQSHAGSAWLPCRGSEACFMAAACMAGRSFRRVPHGWRKLGAGVHLRGNGPQGGFKSGCTGSHLRLEQRLGGNVWQVQTGWGATSGGQKRLAALTVTLKKEARYVKRNLAGGLACFVASPPRTQKDSGHPLMLCALGAYILGVNTQYCSVPPAHLCMASSGKHTPSTGQAHGLHTCPPKKGLVNPRRLREDQCVSVPLVPASRCATIPRTCNVDHEPRPCPSLGPAPLHNGETSLTRPYLDR